MGLPEIKISFNKKAATLIRRSSRGMLVLLLKDETKDHIMNSYSGIEEVEKTDWSEKNYDYLKMAFKGEPEEVVAVRAVIYPETGTVNLAETIPLIRCLNYDWLAYPECSGEDAGLLSSYIKKARGEGKKVKAVLPSQAADCEGIVNFTTDHLLVQWENETELKSYTNAEYTVRIAGILAGLSLNVSSTYVVLDEILDLEQKENPDAAIDAGECILIFDGEKYKVGRGVTSLTTVSEDLPEDFKKIKVVEGADLIRNDITTTFNDEFVGKINNTYDNKQAFVGAVNQYFKDLSGTVLDGNNENYVEVDAAENEAYLKRQGKDTSQMKLQAIKEANTGSHLFLKGKVSLLDAMEDLSLNLSM